ncbi:hypothetical protein HMPREF2785_02410 [Corynebacterium sp. HMSC067D03]|nr:hypothetical protein HMPREF2785_02410 [Corynebacterium sp. HMSC067D03]
MIEVRHFVEWEVFNFLNYSLLEVVFLLEFTKPGDDKSEILFLRPQKKPFRHGFNGHSPRCNA